jgi:trigger factor
MKKKLIALALTACMAMGVMAGCSDEGKDISELKMDKYLTIGDYSTVEVDYAPQKVTDAMVDSKISEIIQGNADAGITEGQCQMGDTVNIDYAGYKDGIPFDGGTAKGQFLTLGSGMFIPGFEEEVAGMSVGENKKFDIAFPAEYGNADLAGQETTFSVTVNYIVPGLSDETVAALGSSEYKTVDELKAYIKTNLEAELQEEDRGHILYLAFVEIMNRSEFKEVPQYLIDAEKARIESQYQYMADNNGMPVDDIVSIVYGVTSEELATEYVKERMICQAIANNEGIEVTDDELNTQLQAAADAQGLTLEGYMLQNGVTNESFREYLLADKVYDFLWDRITVTDTAAE